MHVSFAHAPWNMLENADKHVPTQICLIIFLIDAWNTRLNQIVWRYVPVRKTSNITKRGQTTKVKSCHYNNFFKVHKNTSLFADELCIYNPIKWRDWLKKKFTIFKLLKKLHLISKIIPKLYEIIPQIKRSVRLICLSKEKRFVFTNAWRRNPLDRNLCHHQFYLVHFFFLGGGVRWVLIAARGLSLVAGSGGYSSLRSAGFSAVASLVAEHKL